MWASSKNCLSLWHHFLRRIVIIRTFSYTNLFHFWATVCKTVRSMRSVRCPVCLSASLSCLSVKLGYCGQTVGWVKMKLSMQVGLGPSPKSPKRKRSPQFSANVYCGQTDAWIKMPLATDVGLGPDDIVSLGDPAPLLKKGAEPPP